MQNGSDAGAYAQIFHGCASNKAEMHFGLVIEVLGTTSCDVTSLSLSLT